jgi:hypothetical protein
MDHKAVIRGDIRVRNRPVDVETGDHLCELNVAVIRKLEK